MEKSPYEIFLLECPELAAKFNELVEVQSSMKGLDQKNQTVDKYSHTNIKQEP